MLGDSLFFLRCDHLYLQFHTASLRVMAGQRWKGPTQGMAGMDNDTS